MEEDDVICDGCWRESYIAAEGKALFASTLSLAVSIEFITPKCVSEICLSSFLRPFTHLNSLENLLPRDACCQDEFK